MGKNQKTISLPPSWLVWVEQFLKENEALLSKWDIDTPSKCIKLLSNFGKEPLEAALAKLAEAEKENKAKLKAEAAT